MKGKIKILLADDDAIIRKTLPRQLTDKEFEISSVENGEESLIVIQEEDFDVVLLDVTLPDISGLEILSTLQKLSNPPQVIMLTADNSLTTGIEAMRRGAYHYITKPADTQELKSIIFKAAEKQHLIKENTQLKAALLTQNQQSATDVVYESSVMKKIFAQAAIAARTDTTLLITGESGTGKDILARWIHSHSERAELPFVSVNCGALPENLFESEFFGYEKGSFTGATGQKIGLIESADRSTLFLDEIGEMPLLMQVKLLHFLENSTIRRIGSNRDRKVNVRVIAATNRPLEQDIEAKNFRADLFYRLNIISFHIPPLRERREDIPHLVKLFLDKFRHQFNRPNLQLSKSAQKDLVTREWSGNIRELKNTLERTVVLSISDTINEIYGMEKIIPNQHYSLINNKKNDKIPSLRDLEIQHINHVLLMVDGRREKAASILGITSRTLYRKLKELNIKN